MQLLLVFDWDGTLADSETRIVTTARDAIAQLGLPERSPRAVRGIIGLGLREAAAALYPDLDGSTHLRFIDSYREQFLARAHEPVQLFGGVAGTLAALAARGHELAVATGKSRRGLDRELAEAGLGGLFACSRCADEAPSKPHPGMLLDILERLGREPADTLVIGDTDYDLDMASAAGAAAVAVATGVHDRDRLLAAAPLALLDSVNDLPEWLNRRETLR